MANLKDRDAKVSEQEQQIFALKTQNEVLIEEKAGLQGKIGQMVKDQERLKEDYFKECQQVEAYNSQVKYLLKLLANAHAKTKKVVAQQTEVSSRMTQILNS